MNRIAVQFQNIRKLLPENSKIYFDGDPYKAIKNDRYAIDYLLRGYWFTQLDSADYVVTRNSILNGKKLTDNPVYNLFKVSRKDP